jgi:hypothetical protein
VVVKYTNGGRWFLRAWYLNGDGVEMGYEITLTSNSQMSISASGNQVGIISRSCEIMIWEVGNDVREIYSTSRSIPFSSPHPAEVIIYTNPLTLSSIDPAQKQEGATLARAYAAGPLFFHPLESDSFFAFSCTVEVFTDKNKTYRIHAQKFVKGQPDTETNIELPVCKPKLASISSPVQPRELIRRALFYRQSPRIEITTISWNGFAHLVSSSEIWTSLLEKADLFFDPFDEKFLRLPAKQKSLNFLSKRQVAEFLCPGEEDDFKVRFCQCGCGFKAWCFKKNVVMPKSVAGVGCQELQEMKCTMGVRKISHFMAY